MTMDTPTIPAPTTSVSLSFVPRILVVDDEPRVRAGCTQVLGQEGYQVDSASEGILALDRLKEDHFDVVLLDLMMPNMPGLTVLEKIRERHPDTVVIVITGYATLEHSIRAMKHGAFDFIPKPFTPEQLRVVTSKAIAHTRALQDIATEQSRLRVLIDRLADGVLATNAQGGVMLANPAARRLLRSTAHTLDDRPLEEVIAQTLLPELIDQALASLPPELTEQTREWTVAPQGVHPEFTVSARCLPFRDRLSRNLGTITVLQDITALKKIDQKRSDFVSLVAHEIRSPMSSVLMQVNALQDGLAGDLNEKQKAMLDRITQRIQSLVDLASELLNLAKIESGLIAQERERLDPVPLLQDQIRLHQPLADAKTIRLVARIPEVLPHIVFNRRSLEEVATNLLTNAIKYTPDGGSVTLSAQSSEAELRLDITDTGYGIPPEDLPLIFRRFYRVKNAQTRLITGTGLGLSIVQEILEAHHGRVQVESTLGQGSCFTVYLPIAST